MKFQIVRELEIPDQVLASADYEELLKVIKNLDKTQALKLQNPRPKDFPTLYRLAAALRASITGWGLHKRLATYPHEENDVVYIFHRRT